MLPLSRHFSLRQTAPICTRCRCTAQEAWSFLTEGWPLLPRPPPSHMPGFRGVVNLSDGTLWAAFTLDPSHMYGAILQPDKANPPFYGMCAAPTSVGRRRSRHAIQLCVPCQTLTLNTEPQHLACHVASPLCSFWGLRAERARPAAQAKSVWPWCSFERREQAIMAYDLAALKTQGLQAVLNESMDRRAQCSAVLILRHIASVCVRLHQPKLQRTYCLGRMRLPYRTVCAGCSGTRR